MSFSVPHLNLDTRIEAVLESLLVDREGLRYALVVHAGFRLRDAEVTGYLVIVLSVASLDRLIARVDAWEQPEALTRAAVATDCSRDCCAGSTSSPRRASSRPTTGAA